MERAGISSSITQGLEDTADRVGLLRNQLESAATPLIKLGVNGDLTNQVLLGLASSAGIAGKLGRELADAVAQSAVGIAQGRSELLETSSVLVNASQAQKTYADSLGVSVSALTDEQKALAYTLAVIKETKPDVEDFADTYGEFAQSQSKAARESDELRKKIGTIAQEGFIPLNSAVGTALGFLNDLPEPVQRIGVAMTGAGAGALTLAAGVGTLSLVLGPLAGPAGLFILVAAGIAGLVTAAGTAPGPVRELEGALDDLKAANAEYEQAVKNASEAETTAAEKRLENAKTTAQAALDETRARLTSAQAQLEAAQQAATLNPEGYSFVAPELATNVEAYKKAVAELEQQLKIIDLGGAADVSNPVVRDANGNPTSKPKPDPAPVTPPASGSKDRTVADVFADLNKEGTVAEQKAQALGTVEAAVESLETRARAADSALTEALELGASGEQISYLVGRVQSLNDELTALGERPITIEAEVELARAIELPDVQAFVAELVDIPNPEVQVQITGDPVDIFGVVFDPVTGTTTIGAAPTIKIKAEVDIPDPAVRAILNTQERQILGTGFEAGSSTQKDYGPGAYATVTPSVPLLTSPDYQGALPTVDIDAAYDGITSAGEQFNQSVLDAGLGFVSNIANALADGKITGNEAAGIGSALGAAGGFALGNLLLPGIGGELGKIAGGLLGGGIGGLFGGEDEADSRSRAAKDMERRGGVSSLNINVFANQTNQYDGSPTDPGVAQQFDRNLRRFIEETVKQMDLGKLQKQPA